MDFVVVITGFRAASCGGHPTVPGTLRIGGGEVGTAALLVAPIELQIRRRVRLQLQFPSETLYFRHYEVGRAVPPCSSMAGERGAIIILSYHA